MSKRSKKIVAKPISVEEEVLKHRDSSDPKIREKFYYPDIGVKATYEHTKVSHCGYCSDPDDDSVKTVVEKEVRFYNLPLLVMKSDISGGYLSKEVANKFYTLKMHDGYCKYCESTYKLLDAKLVLTAKLAKEKKEREKNIPITIEDVL